MKLREINERPEWTFWVPDSIADWDAPSHWERERLASMQQHLKPGMVLLDIGTEHGWMSAVYGSFTGHENMILVEPSPEFWPNIRLTWEANHFNHPLACFQGFVSNTATTSAGHSDESGWHPDVLVGEWPECSLGDEIGAMAYRYVNQHHDIPTATIDDIRDEVPTFDAITIDIEGAELLALQGASSTLYFDRPLVWVSIHPDLMLRDFDSAPIQILNTFDEFDYQYELLGIDHEEHWFAWPKERTL